MKMFAIVFSLLSFVQASGQRVSLIRVNSFNEEGYEILKQKESCLILKKSGEASSGSTKLSEKKCVELMGQIIKSLRPMKPKKDCRINLIVSSEVKDLAAQALCLDQTKNFESYSKLVFDLEKARLGL